MRVLRHGCAAVAALVLACCYAPEAFDPDQPVPVEELAKLRVIKVDRPLPAEAGNVYYDEYSRMDTIRIIRFDPPGERAETIMAELTGLAVENLHVGTQERIISTNDGSRSWWLDRIVPGARGAAYNACCP